MLADGGLSWCTGTRGNSYCFHIHGVVTQFVNVSFLCVPVHDDTTADEEELSRCKISTDTV